MTVNSLAFLLFLAVLFVLYYLFPLRFRWTVLLAASVLFYVWACAASPVYLFLTSVCIWGAGLWMERLEQECRQTCALTDRETASGLKKACRKKKKRIAAAAAVFNLAILLVLKYGGFFGGLINSALSLGGVSVTVPKFLAPLGISYYTLIAVSYLVDIYKGKIHAQKNYGKLLLFLAYFPQMTQGPMNRYQPMSGQLYGENRFEYKNFSYGCQRILWGLFKKMVIADNLQPVMKAVFANFEQTSGVVCFLGCVYMTVWMYADFSGYMDIVAGASELFGIHIAENFARPFFAKSLSEYWRRWHITLGSWFRDYMFYPLAVSKAATRFGKKGRKWFGVRVGKLFPSLFALFFVWTCTGFWHDASWRYILWGFANGAVIMGAMVLEPWFEKAKAFLHIRQEGRLWQIFCMVRTFVIVCLLKVFPGPADTAASFRFIGRMFTNFDLPGKWQEIMPKIGRGDAVLLLFSMALVFFVDVIGEKGSFRDALAKRPAVVRWALYLFILVFILAVGKFKVSSTGGFAYAQF